METVERGRSKGGEEGRSHGYVEKFKQASEKQREKEKDSVTGRRKRFFIF